MSKIGLIIKREYSTRVKKKSFIIMTILGPILFAALMITPAILMQLEDDEFKKIAVIDESGVYIDVLEDTKYIEFDNVSAAYLNSTNYTYNLDAALDDLKESDYYALLYIPHTTIDSKYSAVEIYSYNSPNVGLKMHISKVVEKQNEYVRLQFLMDDYGLKQNAVDSVLSVVNSNVNVVTQSLGDDGSVQETFAEVNMMVSYLCGFLIYMFVFMYGSQVMRGVIEEKTNRIIEVIVSSVRPFELMMGKVLGIALVGLTQFVLWVALTAGIVTVAQSVILKDYNPSQLNPSTLSVGSEIGDNSFAPDEEAMKFEKVFQSIYSINFVQIVIYFIIYFLGGYLLYAAMFAAIGSAVDSEADTQQFMLPITLPMVLGLFVMMSAMKNPNGSLAYWFSLIPFTSPIVMMARVPYDPPLIDTIISITLLIGTFIFMTWFAGKIYRVGILMYGKKVSYKELWKWFRYKS